MLRLKTTAAVALGVLALATPAQAMDMQTARSVAREAVAGIAYDLQGETSVFHCREHGVHASCDVQVFGAFQTVRAHVLETEVPGVIHYQVRKLRVVPDLTKPDNAP
jgi:hypothetical protein